MDNSYIYNRQLQQFAQYLSDGDKYFYDAVFYHMRWAIKMLQDKPDKKGVLQTAKISGIMYARVHLSQCTMDVKEEFRKVLMEVEDIGKDNSNVD